MKASQNLLHNAWLCISIVWAVQCTERRESPTLTTGITDEVIYHIVQRSFYDSSGDGHGDLRGIRSKLGTLEELGVTSILLLPLYDSPYYHNYFATDFETIDPYFGMLDDYHGLVRDVHARGMKIYMDMETQYITEDHLWYRDSYGNPASPYTNYLIYNGPGNTEPESIIWDLTELPGYDGTVRKVTTVNLHSSEVFDYHVWLYSNWVDPNGDGIFDDGVDGFRIDHMMDDLDYKGILTNLFGKFWRPLFDTLRSVNPALRFLAEQAHWESYASEYIEDAGADCVFAFNLMWAIASFDVERIARVADSTFGSVADHRQQIVFIENHDTDRFASVTGGDPGRLRIGAALNLLIGGTPMIYYGQELGMRGKGGFGMFGNTDGNDIPRREAYPWHGTVDGEGMALWYRDTGPWWDASTLRDHDGISLEEQRNDPHALWHTYRELLHLRKRNPALVAGKFRNLANDNAYVFTFLRETSGQRLLIAINLSDTVQYTSCAVGAGEKYVLHILSGGGQVIQSVETVSIDLPAYAWVVVEI